MGQMIRNIMIGFSADKTENKDLHQTLTAQSIKSMNLRNGRIKMQESLVGSMMSNHNLSRAKSEYKESKNPYELIRNTNAFIKLKFMSPALSVYDKSIERNHHGDIDKECTDLQSDYRSNSINPDFAKNSEPLQSCYSPFKELNEETILDNISDKSQANNESFDSKANDVDSLLPNLTTESLDNLY